MNIRWNRRRYTQEQFLDAWAQGDSFSDVCTKLGLKPGCGNVNSIQDAAKALGLTHEHFTYNKIRAEGVRRARERDRPTNEVMFAIDSGFKGSSLKKRILAESLLKYVCAIIECPTRSMFDWCGKPLKLQLDHINGNRYDNRLENLRFLCGNCHNQTETYGGSNTRWKGKKSSSAT